MSDYFKITCRLGGNDDQLFTSVVNQGIDAHLQAFTQSKFTQAAGRRVLEFHNSELPILLRRLREIDSDEDAEAAAWADDIERVAKEEGHLK